jgi:hypothetical protein
MNEPATYVLFCGLIAVPAIEYIPRLIEALFTLFLMSSAMMSTPWP